ncbi:bifunctional molybdenum cofactor biosynthesis protein MoaAD [Acetobacter nitrogenifigens DSM 23921 = NBRC 105050]|uniref:Molybdenum cofactor guanylyltransferase n=1 Tax=Acetobacter nitrogenifigens DSM 23921 = NBRC 105050 TaxID=1120919 RepID=A0A511XDP3_9PROT|nr:molybdenum cofactor guanylyltransferase [Acetobacter nitrogenifigens]GBQ97324.1 bifunctional molybdenum cofactor biosynthesis protein MoaAD [Acetobacter nitrogenifigens DSM 23921 = NBRC 105050]GEN61015.1 molybdenum cofactor guanylyltransferase [Acetobacter nitrogenifigens DSM 23921 = NBRC 105050]
MSDDRRHAALILAGGEARRLNGVDKASLDLGGATPLSLLVAALQDACDAIAISTNTRNPATAALEKPMLADPIPGVGPLGGVLAGLEWAHREGFARLMTVPGDTPFIPSNLIEKLAAPLSVASSGGRTHPLIACWPTSAAPTLRNWIEERMAEARPEAGKSAAWRVRDFMKNLGAWRVVEFSAEDGDPFFNINTPQDLAWARTRREASRIDTKNVRS